MLHFFNPGHETAVLNGSPYYMAPANVVTMQRELAFLPAWYANDEDFVFIWDELDSTFYNQIKQSFDFKPKPITKDQLQTLNNQHLNLWGISPQSIHFFQELKDNFTLDIHIPEWSSEYIYLNSRNAAFDCLSALSANIDWVSDELLPLYFDNLDDIEKYVESKSYQLLAKAPYSSSGRGLLWLPIGGLTRTERQILHGHLKKQERVSIEKALDKKGDFAMEFMSNGDGRVVFMGYSLFYTNSKGAYEGNFLGSQIEIESYLLKSIFQEKLETVKFNLENILSKKYGNIYTGCIGVDMLIYEEDNTLKIHPCIEINMRSNMGLLALRISENYIAPASKGQFKLDFSPKVGEIYKGHLEMQEMYPPVFSNNRIVSGYMPLCPVMESNHYRAYILVK